MGEGQIAENTAGKSIKWVKLWMIKEKQIKNCTINPKSPLTFKWKKK